MLTKLLVSIIRLSDGQLSHNRRFHISASAYFKDYYEILSIPRNSSIEDIKTAYYTKAKTHHPDKNSGGSKKFQEITEAYKILSDPPKRRVYDSTLRTTHTTNSTATDYKAARPQTPAQNVSLKHIHHVYRTMNREEKEEPKFRMFEDHTYPGTDFNRFEYSRTWNSESKCWSYLKRNDIKEYVRKSEESMKIVKICIGVLTFGVIMHILNWKVFMKRFSKQSNKNKAERHSDTAGMYVMNGDDK